MRHMRSPLLQKNSLPVQRGGHDFPQIVRKKAQVGKREVYAKRVLVLGSGRMYSRS